MKSISNIVLCLWFCILPMACGGSSNKAPDASADVVDAADSNDLDDAGIVTQEQDSGVDDATSGQDAGFDGGADFSDSEHADLDGADTDEVFSLEIDLPDGWQRGPVRLALRAFGPSGRQGRISVSWSQDQASFQPATALAGTATGLSGLALLPEGIPVLFVWDSKKDISEDVESVFLHVTLRVDGELKASSDAGPMAILNAQDKDRLLIVPHPYDIDSEGSPIPGEISSVLKLLSDGSIVDTGEEIFSGQGPLQAIFTADGRYLVVLGDGPGHNHYSLKSFEVGRDDSLESLGPSIELFDLELSCSDMVPAMDGSGIWLVRSSGVGGLFFLSLEDAQPELMHNQQGGYYLVPITLPSAMAILPDNRRAILSGGALASDVPPYDVTMVDLQSMEILQQVDMGLDQLSEAVAITPDGKYALMPSGDFGQGGTLWMVGIDGDQIAQGQWVSVPSPAKIRVHPQGSAAILTSWYPGSIKIIDLTGGAPRIVKSFDGIGLADYLSCVNEGSLEGLCVTTGTSASTGVSSIVPVRFFPDASAEQLTNFDFGDGYTSIVSGPAIQP